MLAVHLAGACTGGGRFGCRAVYDRCLISFAVPEPANHTCRLARKSELGGVGKWAALQL